ncbi:MAG TPA: hypothetical protein VN651_01975 [Gemmatimonadaceae bacterium]|nr:hypothetical protein [Gemmatimonadaceae bacterium]
MPTSRRLVAALVRTGLVVLAIIVVVAWFTRHMPHRRHMQVQVQSEAPPAPALGPGDLRIYNTDSAVDLTLQGNRILAGLSEKTVAKVKSKLDSATRRDTGGGLGASIGQIVRQSVAGAIGTHAVFPLADIRDIHADGGRILIDWTDGGHHELFGSTKVNDNKVSNTFSPDDAKRFVDAVRARKGLPTADASHP